MPPIRLPPPISSSSYSRPSHSRPTSMTTSCLPPNPLIPSRSWLPDSRILFGPSFSPTLAMTYMHQVMSTMTLSASPPYLASFPTASCPGLWTSQPSSASRGSRCGPPLSIATPSASTYHNSSPRASYPSKKVTSLSLSLSFFPSLHSFIDPS